MTTLRLIDHVGSNFAENKDVARQIRLELLWPAVQRGQQMTIDFAGIEDATQSFVHAMLSQMIRDTQGEVLDLLSFQNCNETVKKIINMVVDYMLEG